MAPSQPVRALQASVRHRPRTVLACLLLLMGALGGGPVSAAVPEVIPVIAGTTTVVFQGTSGIRLRVPEKVSLSGEDFELSLDGEAAFGVLSPLDSPCRAAFLSDDGDPQWCFDYGFRMVEGWVGSPNVIAPGIFTLPAGRIDLYMVTEGQVTMRFTVPELDGQASYDATGLLAGDIRPQPVTCPSQELVGCDRQGWGGQQFTGIAPPASMGVVTFAQRPNTLPTGDMSPGTVGVGSCIYPSFSNPEKSARVDDHPSGCDLDEDGGLNFRNTYVVNSTANPTVVSIAHVRHELVTTKGPRYAGFAAHQVESAEMLEGSGNFGSYAYWHSREIRCPSGDWANCR